LKESRLAMELADTHPCARLNRSITGTSAVVIVDTLYRWGLRGSHFHLSSLGSVGLCIGLWIRAKTVDQDERGNAERRALFVGLWAPTLWQIGDSLRGAEQPRRRSR
jgi:hypothetical protein